MEKCLSRPNELATGQQQARNVLDYLEDPVGLYRQAGNTERLRLTRPLLRKLKIDVPDPDADPLVVDDQLTDPFATVVQLRREREPLT